MEYHQQNPYPYPYYRRFAPTRDRAPPVRWVKEWIPQELASNGARCSLVRWVREDMMQTLKDKAKAPEMEEAKPEPTTEVLFLCSFEGCGRTFVDVLALRKHANIHGERQYICHYAGCGKKFLDSSKLKRHFLIHTGERDFVCPHEGCGKAFSLDFNLRAHMKTHLAENYHVCSFPECGKRYTNEFKLRTHMKSHHDKNMPVEVPKPTHFTQKPAGEVVRYAPMRQAEKPHYTTPKTLASSSGYTGTATPDRPFACPHDGCDKAYIHEYKLNLHLRTNHPNEETANNYNNWNGESNSRLATPSPVSVNVANANKRSKPNPRAQMELSKAVSVNEKGLGLRSLGACKQVYLEEDEEGDSEETEDENGKGNGEDRWGYEIERIGGDEETEDED